ncbi:MAG: hypothetical protein LBU85_09810 [Treponema sp.]|jgi:hypothetical protein|nr:hypothetical protein [Treponema sp.]
MDKIVKFIVLAVITVCCLPVCHLFDDRGEMDTVAVYFDESNVTVFEGGLGSVTLRVEPADVLADSNVEYEMGDEEVAVIYRADKRGCVFYGKKAGSTVLTARIRGAQAKMVVTVLSN